MFKWLNKQGVESDQGFIVQCTGRFTIEYIEGVKKIIIETEAGIKNGKNCVIIFPYAFEKWDNGTPISQEKQDQILKNFTEAMAFQNIGVIVD